VEGDVDSRVQVESWRKMEARQHKTELEINKSTNHYFTACPKDYRRAGQLSLPHAGITKTEKNRTKIHRRAR